MMKMLRTGLAKLDRLGVLAVYYRVEKMRCVYGWLVIALEIPGDIRRSRCLCEIYDGRDDGETKRWEKGFV